MSWTLFYRRFVGVEYDRDLLDQPEWFDAPTDQFCSVLSPTATTPAEAGAQLGDVAN